MCSVFLCVGRETLFDTLSSSIPLSTYDMTKYDFLLQKKASGELKVLLLLGLPTQLLFHMEICAFHLENPHLSQFQTALEMNTSKRMVQRAYDLLEELHF